MLLVSAARTYELSRRIMNPEPSSNFSWTQRILDGILAVFWCAMLGMLILHAPALGKVFGFAWIIIALIAPRVYLVTLVAALPLFGNNPGGPHHLYLLEVGMMAYVIRRFAERAIRHIPMPSVDSIQALLACAFFGFSTGAMVPQLARIACEIQVEGTSFLFANYYHYGNSPVFGIHAWTCLALSIAFYSCLRSEVAESPARAVLIWAMLGSAIVAAVIGLLEYAELISLAWWRADNLMISRFGYRRLQSLFWHSGWFGQYLAAVAPAALALALAGRGRTRYVAGAIYLVLGCAELFTLQRGAWLGFLAGSSVVSLGFMFSSVARDARGRFVRRTLMICASVGTLVVVAALVHAPLRSRMMEIAKVSDRSGLWGGAWEIGMLRPLTGAGFGNFTSVHRWRFTEGSPYFEVDDKTTAHSLVLHIFAERGALTVICFIALMAISLGGVATSVYRCGRQEESQDGHALIERLAVLGGLTAISVDGIFQYSFYLRVTEILFWILLAWAGRSFILFPTGVKWTGSWWLRALCVILCAALIVFWLRDYFAVDQDVIQGYKTAGKEVEIEIPSDGTRFALGILSYDPLIVEGEPLTYAVWFRGELVATHIFRRLEPVELEIALPPDRKPEEKLKIISSRVWNPYMVTNRLIANLEAGVCYRNLRPLDAALGPEDTP